MTAIDHISLLSLGAVLGLSGCTRDNPAYDGLSDGGSGTSSATGSTAESTAETGSSTSPTTTGLERRDLLGAHADAVRPPEPRAQGAGD